MFGGMVSSGSLFAQNVGFGNREVMGKRRVAPRYNSPEKHWKEVLVQRALDRVKETRAAALARRRLETSQTVAPVSVAEGRESLRDTLMTEAARFNDAPPQPMEQARGGSQGADVGYWGELSPSELSAEQIDQLLLELQEAMERDNESLEREWAERRAQEDAEEIAAELAALDFFDQQRMRQLVRCPSCTSDSSAHADAAPSCSCGTTSQKPPGDTDELMEVRAFPRKLPELAVPMIT